MSLKHTTNRSERDINLKFNLVEFNRLFEQNLTLENKKENNLSQPYKINILFITSFIMIMIGIFLILFPKIL